MTQQWPFEFFFFFEFLGNPLLRDYAYPAHPGPWFFPWIRNFCNLNLEPLESAFFGWNPCGKNLGFQGANLGKIKIFLRGKQIATHHFFVPEISETSRELPHLFFHWILYLFVFSCLMAPLWRDLLYTAGCEIWRTHRTRKTWRFPRSEKMFRSRGDELSTVGNNWSNWLYHIYLFHILSLTILVALYLPRVEIWSHSSHIRWYL